MVKLIGSMACLVAGLVLGVGDLVVMIPASYQYEREVSSSWELADKASTIVQKSQYIDKFVADLESQNLAGDYNAWLYPTPNNSFDRNLEALKSLQARLREVQTMNPSSFEYQTAMQQITAQEQGEAEAMLGVFSGCWWKRYHFFLWDWVGLVNGMVVVTLLIIGSMLALIWHSDR